jgi:streptogramin lyase
MKRIIRILSFLVFLLSILQACSKGSGGSTPTNNVMVTTIAGNGTLGYVDGEGIDAEFYSPRGVAVDATGNIFVAEGSLSDIDGFTPSNNRIRKITPTGIVSTLAGNGIPGFANGPGITAQFNGPYGDAVDGQGNVYVAEFANNIIRKITSSAIVTTLAGDRSAGFADGIDTIAEFNAPWGVTLDMQGNFYVADRNNNRIRKITASGVVSTLAGNGIAGNVDGTGSNAEFNNPTGVTVDNQGNVYVADWLNHLIRKVTPDGTVTTLAGSGTPSFADGIGKNASFNQPVGVAVDSQGNVYVADENNNRVRKITPTGVVTTLAGNGTQGFADGTYNTAEFNLPVGVALDAQGNVYVADQYNNRIRKISVN